MTANGCGTHARWTTGCPECQRLSRAYERRRRTAIRNGTWKPQVPQAKVAAHLDGLLADGANLPGVAEASGLSVRTLIGIRQREWVQGETAAALLAVTSAPYLPPAGMSSALGTCRRIRALVALGWTLSEQSRRLGMHLQQVQLISSGKQALVSEGTRTAVDALFDQLCTVPGGSTRARNDAARKGWLPPLAWDDIDDPDGEPSIGEVDETAVDEVAIERALGGERLELTDAELVMVLQAGVARGRPLSALTKQLGLNYFTANKLLGVEKTPRKLMQERVEAELTRVPDRPDSHIAALLDVHHQTVTRARARLVKSGALVAA